MDGPVVVAISVPAGPGDNLDEYAKPILDLLCRHGVVMADTARPVHGISLIWHDAPEIEVSVEPAALREVSNE